MQPERVDMRLRYHLRILVLGVPVLVIGAGIIYGMTFLPLWAIGTPLLLWISYCLGKMVEIWANS